MWAPSISIRANQVMSVETDAEDLEFFQRKISDHFSDLMVPPRDEPKQAATPSGDSTTPLAPDGDSGVGVGVSTPAAARSDTMDSNNEGMFSIGWLRKLVAAFLCCEAEFKAAILMGRDPSLVMKAPLDKLIPDMLERGVKALDVCNAVSNGVDAVRFMHSQAIIVVSALHQRPFTDGQIRRARRALAAVLASIVVDEKEGSKTGDRLRSFSRRGGGSASGKERNHAPSFRSLSWNVTKNWSATKQIQALSSNLYVPRGGDSTGLALIVHVMSVVLAFVMWALVAAIPCQERTGLGAQNPAPKQSNWVHGLCGLQEKIAEEWKRKEKKGSAGLMDELVKVETLAQSLLDLTDKFKYPMEEDKEAEVAAKVAELAEICQRMEDGLGPLQQQIREVFHRLVRCRSVFLQVFEHAGNPSNANSGVRPVSGNLSNANSGVRPV